MKFLRALSVFASIASLAFSQTPAEQKLSDHIVIDQFGYRPLAKKFAIIRSPQQGRDATETAKSFTPSDEYQVINETTGAVAFEEKPTEFNGGTTDAVSGDKIWHFNFSEVQNEGRYYILDKGKNLRSFAFSVKKDVYNEVLKAAVKMFYYQRAGTDKPSQFAGENWADGVNFSQDAQSRLFSDKNNAATERDLRGGWFDAGDYNKYTKWTADYVENMLLAFEENAEAFTDDYEIPESGNGVPDILDEAKWGLAWLMKMQNEDGSLLCVQGLSDGSPPSKVTKASYYGPANATATYGGARAFAVASRIFALRGENSFANDLKARALKAFNWAEAHQDSIYHNNNNNLTPGSKDLAAGDQELNDDWDRVENRISAALYLYEITNNDALLKIFDDNWVALPIHAWGGVMQQWRYSQHLLLMKYLESSFGTESVKTAIRNDFKKGFLPSSDIDFGNAYNTDGYRSFIYNYQWGSNKIKNDYGLTFYKWNIVDNGAKGADGADYKDVAEDYIHYIHGANPLNTVFLTNMSKYGASKSLTTIYHTWFADGSAKWDITTESNPGPAPGYMSGGPNEGFKKDACCDNGCGGAASNAVCLSEDLPVGEPPAKMYKDFNTSWPLNSWEITEPSDGYQMSYIRLLSKFVENKGWNLPIKKRNGGVSAEVRFENNYLLINLGNSGNITLNNANVSIYNLKGKCLKNENGRGQFKVNTADLPSGLYLVKITDGVKSSAIYYPKNM